jgi:mediator of RNA polymerase II transcription subunit 31
VFSISDNSLICVCVCVFVVVVIMANYMMPNNYPPYAQHYNQYRSNEIDHHDRKRFLVELEFVQCLANPKYLYYLAKHGYFKRDEFKNYLKYLLYWKEPDYIKFIKYPECLHFLDLLQYDGVCANLSNMDCISFVSDQQLLNWRFHQRKRQNYVEPSEAIVPLIPPFQQQQQDLDIANNLKTESKTHATKPVFTSNRSIDKIINKSNKKLAKH